jgi:enoyl-CoA hydratase/carnithine racemase
MDIRTERVPVGESGGAILVICLDRPKVKNAISAKTWRELREALELASADEGIFAVVLTGGNPAVTTSPTSSERILTSYFTAGADLGDSSSRSAETINVDLGYFLTTLVRFSKLLVVAVNGHAVGAGVTMLPHADLVFVVEGATFSCPFVDLGIVPELASSVTFPYILGPSLAKDVLFSGRKLTAAEALTTGLAAALLPPTPTFLSDVVSRVASIVTANAHAPESIVVGKRLMQSVAYGIGTDAIAALAAKELSVINDRVLSGLSAEAAVESMQRRRSRTPKL